MTTQSCYSTMWGIYKVCERVAQCARWTIYVGLLPRRGYVCIRMGTDLSSWPRKTTGITESKPHGRLLSNALMPKQFFITDHILRTWLIYSKPKSILFNGRITIPVTATCYGDGWSRSLETALQPGGLALKAHGGHCSRTQGWQWHVHREEADCKEHRGSHPGSSWERLRPSVRASLGWNVPSVQTPREQERPVPTCPCVCRPSEAHTVLKIRVIFKGIWVIREITGSDYKGESFLPLMNLVGATFSWQRAGKSAPWLFHSRALFVPCLKQSARTEDTTWTAW